MRDFERADMPRFGIRPGRAFELDATYLTVVVVELLEFLGVGMECFLHDSFLLLEN